MTTALIYPTQYIRQIELKDGTSVLLRPIRSDDSRQASHFEEKVSTQSFHQRFMGYVNITEKLVKRFTQIDYSQEMAIVAEIQQGDSKEIIGIARIAKDKEKVAEFAIIIADRWQGKGLGMCLSNYILQVAKEMGYESIYAFLYADNIPMLNILKGLGFKVRKEDYLTTYAELKF